jgi:hypothetical protein
LCAGSLAREGGIVKKFVLRSLVASSIFIAGCAALNSYSELHEGVPYYLPRTLVRYTVDQGNPAKTTIDAIDVAESKPRYLSYQASGFADENVCIDRTEEGL